MKVINVSDKVSFAGWASNRICGMHGVFFTVTSVLDDYLQLQSKPGSELFEIHRRQVTKIKRKKPKNLKPTKKHSMSWLLGPFKNSV